jgi:hypothetical protein
MADGAPAKDQQSAVQALLDEREIERVLVRNARGVDRCDEALIASAYHEDSYDEHGPFQGTGREFAKWVVGILRSVFEATSHRISNATIDLRGDEAKVESYVVAYHKTRAPANGNANLVVVGGRYLDVFARRGGEWKIARRVVVVDWSHVTAMKDTFPTEGYTLGGRSPDDPSYGSLFGA